MIPTMAHLPARESCGGCCGTVIAGTLIVIVILIIPFLMMLEPR